jgi:hypothetical protein
MDYSKQERGNKMKYKALFIFFFGIVLSLMFNSKSYASWPIVIAPAIEGQVMDATTGEPIENAIIEITWETSVYAVVDRSSGKAGYKLIATGKDGKYRIPSKVMLQPLGGFFSSFRGINIVVRHPLYESKDVSIWISSIGGDRKIKQEVNLLSLEEKYKNIDRTKMYTDKIPMQINNLSDEMTNGTYFVLANKIDISTDYIKYIFGKWDGIILNYKPEERAYLYNELDKFKKYYNLK